MNTICSTLLWLTLFGYIVQYDGGAMSNTTVMFVYVICMYVANIGALPHSLPKTCLFNKCYVNFSLIHVFLL